MENISQEQKDLLHKLQALDPDLEVQWDEARGVASSIRGRLGSYTAEVKEGKIETFLQEYGPLFGPSELPDGLELLRHKRDELGWHHLVFQHFVAQKLEVYGAKLAAHANTNGGLVEVQSSLWRNTQVDTEPKIKPEKLREILAKRIEGLSDFKMLRARAEEREPLFPMTDRPRLVLYCWEGKFRLAWITYGYGDLVDRESGSPGTPYITYGRIFVDAVTGERFLFAPTFRSAENPTVGTGTAVTPLTGTHATRTLNIVRMDNTSTYRLKDTTHSRDIVTYDAACESKYDSLDEIANALKKGDLPVSQDTDGDHNWDRLPKNTTAAERTSGQQPEVDAHYFARRQFEWYDAISGGRDGWDDGNYPNPPVPPQTIHIVTHCRLPGGTCQTNDSYYWIMKSTWGQKNAASTWVSWLAFMDGDAINYDYLAGSHFIVAHEYQHAITDFTFEDGTHDPGLNYVFFKWSAAVHEGLSDAFAGLSTEQWLPCRDISHIKPGKVFRNLVFPRDANADCPNMLDHFDDRTITNDGHSRGTILAHVAYLMGKGGVHQRTSRTPELLALS